MFTSIFALLGTITTADFVLSLIFVLAVIAFTWLTVRRRDWWLLAVIAVGVFATFFLGWWFLLWTVLISGCVYLFLLVKKPILKILAILAIAGLMLCSELTIPTISLPFTAPESCSPAANPDLTTGDITEDITSDNPTTCTLAENLGFTTGGMVENNLDDGDAVMGTILMVTRDNPTKDPVLFVIMPGASVDVEYLGQMYFTSDRFNGSLAEGVCLAEKLYTGNIDDLIVVGANSGDTLPTGWKTADKVDGWWKASTWLYEETKIDPRGLTASEGIFVSTIQSNRTLKTGNNEVIYGQFWQTPGYVTHVQVRPNDEMPIPEGYQGTYWIWSGDFTVGESDLQKRMLQATFHEVVDRDDVLSVTLLACGTLPPELDESVYTLYTGDTQFGDVTWQSSLEGWTCQPNN